MAAGKAPVTSPADVRAPRTIRERITRGGRLGLAVLGALMLLAVVGLIYIVEIPFLLLFGWTVYVADILPRVPPNWGAVASFIVVLGLLFVTGHRFLAWLGARMTPPRRWRLLDTGAALGLLVSLFAASMAITGIGHQVGWLAQTGEPLVVSSWEEMIDHRRASRQCEMAWASAVQDKRFVLDKLPPSDATFQIAPIGIEADSAAEVLIFVRDPAGLKIRAGVLCSTRSKLSAEKVAETLAHLKPTAPGAPVNR